MIALIVAMGTHNGIGLNNKLLWRLPEDMQRFKKITLGHSVVMGRKTWDSLPAQYKPLIWRHNIVLSRTTTHIVNGVTVVPSLEAAIASADGEPLFVIGGGNVYEQAMPSASTLYITEVFDSSPADTYFPNIDLNVWKEVRRVPGNPQGRYENKNHIPVMYDFVTYIRRTKYIENDLIGYSD